MCCSFTFCNLTGSICNIGKRKSLINNRVGKQMGLNDKKKLYKKWKIEKSNY